jgi:hypothetical protein
LTNEHDEIPGVTDDPVLRLILSGRAANLNEAEEIYLDESLDEIMALIAGQTGETLTWGQQKGQTGGLGIYHARGYFTTSVVCGCVGPGSSPVA